MKRNCASCKYSQATVICNGFCTSVEWRCTKSENAIIYVDQNYGSPYYCRDFGPECPKGLYKREP